MPLPTFIGIGAQKAGSTWLHHLLSSHPDIYMPQSRKEVHYFDWHFHKGLEWYQDFFADAGQAKALGEISPDYLHDPEAPKRIAQLLPEARLIVILRHPVDRAYSHYTMLAGDENLKDTFEEAVQKRPELLDRGRYAHHLQTYFQLYTASHILVLIFEEATQNVELTKQTIANFLKVEVSHFPHDAGTKRVYETASPKYRQLFAMAKWLSFRLHKYDLSAFVNIAKKMGMSKLFGKGETRDPMLPETREKLYDLYREDIAHLERLTQKDLSIWQRSKS
jgi:Sulfotransferase domain